MGFGALFCAVAALLLSGPLGNLHVACAHDGGGPAPARNCDLCAKIFGNPPVETAVPELPSVAMAGEKILPTVPAPIETTRVACCGRDPPVAVFLV